MPKQSTTKIEKKAISVLESIINEHPKMDHKFNTDDKEIAWDGYIILFKNCDQSKKNFDNRVPVQIKGHNDEKQRYIHKEKIRYKVYIDDLKAYATEKGVLYFQVFFKDKDKQVFYCSLYPSKIADYLDEAQNRHNEKSINIPFSKLDSTPEALYVAAKQFSEEAAKQGSGSNPLVKDRIRKQDFDKIKSLDASVVGAKNSYEAFARLSSGDVCIYGKTDDDKYERPLEWLDNAVFSLEEEVDKKISVDDIVYYNKYRFKADSKGGMVITLSPNLKLIFDKKQYKINYTAISTFKEIHNDVRFLLHSIKNKSIILGGEKIFFGFSLKNEQITKLELHNKLCDLLEGIGFETSMTWSQLSEIQINQLYKLVEIYYSSLEKRFAEKYYKLLWSFDGKYFPIVIYKHDNESEFINAVYTDQLAIFLPDDNKNSKGFRMPLFANYTAEILSNLFYYNYDLFRKQINSCEINNITQPALNNCVLLLINVFDRNRDVNFLDLAEYLLNRLDFSKNDYSYMLNKIQISKRKDKIDEEEIEYLNSLNDIDIYVRFGKYVLLDDKINASMVFNQFSEDEKEYFKNLPIYNLFLNLS